MIGDALHSVTDLANNVFAWLAISVAEQPPDQDHPYGHRKFEAYAAKRLNSDLLAADAHRRRRCLR
ncbi:MAG: divalent metal cation (Fe/Co/Zn/Cd) transporter [Hyphomicrobiaceae bacterium]